MGERDTSSRINARKKFRTFFPYFGEPASEQYIGPSEIVYTLEDGRRVIYDEVDDVVTVYQRIDDEIDILPEEVWKKEFARILKRRIHLSGMTQGEFADRIGINQATISRYMRKQSIPSAHVLKTMAKVLKCDIDSLCSFDYLL